MNENIITLVYVVCSIFFILGIKMLGNAQTARKGNMLSAVGMLIAVSITLFNNEILSYTWIIAGIAIGGTIGFVAAKKVPMTGMPEMVALFNGFGGLASLLIGWYEFTKDSESSFTIITVLLAILIGGITFTGSIYAYGKLSGKISGKAKVFKGQKALNIAIFGLSVVAIVLASMGIQSQCMVYLAIILALVLGFTFVMPIGGGDMPVVISLLNSLSGLAAAAAGFAINNSVLIVAGCLVGASGVILTVIMCKAMNRTLFNVLFGGFGATEQSSSGTAITGEMKAASVEDAYYVLENARSVVIIPGYGMAVAQAQHAVKELGQLLEDNGAEVRYAIHPVAGRMPGHMNVLLAEADVPYEQLNEMDQVNPIIESIDVAIIIGANDVVNPAATQDTASPIYGMPIIEAYKAKTVYCLKRGKGAGFSGLVNQLFFMPNTRMLYGDAKQTVSDLVASFKS